MRFVLARRTACLAALLVASLASLGRSDAAPAPEHVAACVDAVAPGAGWYPSVSPSEAGHRSTRDHLFSGACGALHPSLGRWPAPRLLARTPGLANGYNAVTRERDQVFVLGGAFGVIGADNGPYVAALSAYGPEVRWRRRLPGIGPADWNYPGVLGVHRNGDLYVTYGRRLARLDPADGRVKAVLELPLNHPAQDVAYNGFGVLADGRIVAKSIHRKAGCTAPDFAAFVRCDTDGVSASTIAVVDPETMQLVASAVAPEHIRFRVTTSIVDGTEYVYLPGERRLHRYRWAGGALARDPDWQVDYLSPGQTAGTAVAALGDWIVVQTNGIPSRVPMSIVAVSQRDARRTHKVSPFADRPGASFIPSLPTVDADHRRIYTFDGFVGEAAAVDLDPERGLAVAWRVPQRSFAFSMLVGPPDARVWVGTDLDDWKARAVFKVLPFEALRRLPDGESRVREALVWRDARSGRELGRVPAVAAVGGGAPVPGYGATVLVPDLSDGSLVAAGP